MPNPIYKNNYLGPFPKLFYSGQIMSGVAHLWGNVYDLSADRDKLANLTHLKSHSSKTQLFWGGLGEGEESEVLFQEAYMTVFSLLLTRDFKP